MSVETISRPETGQQAAMNSGSASPDTRYGAEPPEGQLFTVEDVGSGYLFPRRVGRMALTSGFAENFQTDRVMPRRLPVPERLVPQVEVGPEYYLG